MKKVALITGSSRGIGAAAALALSDEGYAVCINCIERIDLAESLAARLRAMGREAIAHQCDVADSAAVREMVSRIERELESMNREQAEIEQINECLKRHLQILSSMRPQTWSTEGFNERLGEAIPKLDRAINDFEEAYAMPGRYRHTDVFQYKPGTDERRGIDWADLKIRAAQGFFFHLPLFILLLITWGVCTLISLI